MNTWSITTNAGTREWQADDEDHALEQHHDAFPDEVVLAISRRVDLNEYPTSANQPLGS